jgi:hypothetical protein
MDTPISFKLYGSFFYGAFEYGHVGVFKLLRWMQALSQSTWDQEILYTNGFSKDEQLLTRPLLREKKRRAVDLKFTYCFMETTHEALQLRRFMQ